MRIFYLIFLSITTLLILLFFTSYSYAVDYYLVRLTTNSPPFGESIIVDNTHFVFPDFNDITIMLSAGTHSIRAIAPPGYGFLRWYDTNNTRVSNIYSSSTTFTVKGNGVVGAEFGPIVTFYTSPPNGGSISVEYYGDPQNPIKTYSNGQSDVINNVASRLRANPSPGYVFVKWTTTGNVTTYSPHSNPTEWSPSGPGTVTAVFQQATYTYMISFQILDDAGSSVSGATIVFDGVSYSHGGSVSKPAGTYSLATGTIPSGYRFSQWQASGSVTIANPSSSSTTATVSGSGTITLRLQRTASVTFSVSGLGSDASGTVLTVDGTNYAYADLPKTFTWDVGSSHSFSWSDPVSAGTDKRYAWVSTSGLSTAKSGTINVPAGGGSVTATYAAEYKWTFSSSGLSSDAISTVVTVDGNNYGYSSLPVTVWWRSGTSHSYSYQQYVQTSSSGKRYANHSPPLWSGTVTGSGSPKSPPYHVEYKLTVNVNPSGGGSVSASPSSSDWFYDDGTSVTLTASANSGYALDAWTGDASGTGASVSVTMNAPKTVTANFFTFSIGVNPTSGSVNSGGSVSATVTVTYGSGVDSKSISFTASGLPSGTSVSFTPSSVTISPSATSGSSTMTITTGASTPTGTYTITITGSGGGVSKTTTYTLTINPATYAVSFQILDDAGDSFSGATLAFDGVSYSHGGSVLKTAGTYSLSTGTIPSGYRFSQWQVSGSISIANPSSSSTTATVSGTGTITMRLQRTTTVTFSVNEMSSDASGTVLTVDGVNYAYADLPKTFTWNVGSTHSFAWADYVSAGSDKRYAWVSTSGLAATITGTIIVPAGGGSVTATYKTQYRWVFSQNGVGSDAPGTGTIVTIDGSNYNYSSLPLTFWWDSGSGHSYSYLEHVPSSTFGKRYANHNPPSWSGTILGPRNLNPTYHIEYRLTISVSSSGAGSTSPAPGSYWYDSGSTVSVFATANAGGTNSPAGFLIQYIFTGWSGDLTSNDPNIIIVMDGPKTVIANWRIDYSGLIMVSTVAIVATLMSTILYHRLRGKQAKETTIIDESEQIIEYLKRLDELYRDGKITKEVYETLKAEYEEKLKHDRSNNPQTRGNRSS